MPVIRASSATRVVELLHESGIATQRAVMPTRDNLDMYEKLLHAATNLVDMKRQVDRVDQEIRTLHAQSKGFIPPANSRVSLNYQ